MVLTSKAGTLIYYTMGAYVAEVNGHLGGSVIVYTNYKPWRIGTNESRYGEYTVDKKEWIVRKSIIGNGEWMRNNVSSFDKSFVPTPGWIADVLDCVLEHEINKMIVE